MRRKLFRMLIGAELRTAIVNEPLTSESRMNVDPECHGGPAGIAKASQPLREHLTRYILAMFVERHDDGILGEDRGESGGFLGQAILRTACATVGDFDHVDGAYAQCAPVPRGAL